MTECNTQTLDAPGCADGQPRVVPHGARQAAPVTLFDTGFVIRTPGAMAALFAARVTESSLIQRHESGDFGDVDWQTERANWRALQAGGTVQSVYTLEGGARIRLLSTPELRTTTLSLIDTL